MTVVLRWDSLETRLPRRQILQGFVNHGGTLYKAYVVDQMASYSLFFALGMPTSNCKTEAVTSNVI